MNWDEKAEDAAQPFGDCRAHDMRFVHGAEWQREQLLSPESVSKAAISLCRHEYPLEEDFHYHWENFNSLYIEKATTALAATLLRED